MKKFLLFTICLIFVILFILYRALILSKIAEDNYLVARYLSHVINVVMHIPSSSKEAVIGNYRDIIRPSKSEWMKMKCSKRSRDNLVYYRGQHNLTDAEREHISCLQVKEYMWNPKNAYLYQVFHSDKYRKEFIEVTVGDYILQYPEILKSMLKVASNPCKYVRRLEDADKLGLTESQKDDFIDSVETFREMLNCDAPPKWPFRAKRWVFFIIKGSGDEDIPILLHRQDLKY